VPAGAGYQGELIGTRRDERTTKQFVDCSKAINGNWA